jgi:hypothetical protein
MLVDYAAGRRLEGRRKGAGRFDDVLVDERLQLRPLILRDKRIHRDEELGLAPVEIAKGLKEQRDVPLLLPEGRGRRMLAGAREVRAVGRTRDLGEPLRPAADGADLAIERRTRAARLAGPTKGTNHCRIIV